jgi:hypothetical protein
VQAAAWTGLAAAWAFGGPHGAILEADLSAAVRPAAILPGAVDALLRLLERLESSNELSLPSRYCVDAVRAAVCAAAGRPNPRAAAWTEVFFGLELFCRDAGERVTPAHRALVVSEARARATIAPDDAERALRRHFAGVVSSGSEAEQQGRLRHLQDIGAKAGYPDLLRRAARQGLRIQLKADEPIDPLLALLREVAAKSAGADILMVALGACAESLIRDRRVDDLEVLAREALGLLGGGDEGRARVIAWLGACLKRLRLPGRALAALGARAEGWEAKLAPRVRATLWTERANVLALLGPAAGGPGDQPECRDVAGRPH